MDMQVKGSTVELELPIALAPTIPEQYPFSAPFKLPAEVKETWIKALRSGKFTQGTNFLHNPEHDSYCCLGVLRQLYPFRLHRARSQEVLDRVEWARLGNVPHNSDVPIAIANNVQSHLAHLNDTGHTFPAIAAWIEANL